MLRSSGSELGGLQLVERVVQQPRRARVLLA
jgi:hypothetical protein